MNVRSARLTAGARIIAVVTAGWVCVVAAAFAATAGPLEVRMFDVGQADAILVTCPEGRHRMLIDAGDTRYPGSAAAFKAALTSALKDHGDRLDVVVATHMHSDHIGSMLWVLQNHSVGTYIDNGSRSAETMVAARLDKFRRKLVAEGRMNYVRGGNAASERIEFCPMVTVTTLVPWSRRRLSGENDRSVAVRIEYAGKSFLLGGDLEEKAENVMLAEYSAEERGLLDADVLKVGHHCSGTSSCADFVQAVSPEVVLVSCGRPDVGTNAGYHHPHLTTMRRFGDWFRNHGAQLKAEPARVPAFDRSAKKWVRTDRPEGMWITAIDGSIVVTWDGRDLTVAGATD